MKYEKEYKKIYELISSLPVFSDHEHHRRDSFFASKITLDDIINNSYIAWTGFRADKSVQSRASVLENTRYGSYFRWLEKGIQKVHGIKGDITLETWDYISTTIEKKYLNDKDFHWQALSSNGFERIIQDSYDDPGSDLGHPEIFTPSFRLDFFMNGHHEQALAPLFDINIWSHYNIRPASIDDYTAFMEETITNQYNLGKVASLKCAEAYCRPINFENDDYEIAKSAFGKHPDEVSAHEKKIFGNYIFQRGCILAAKLNIPFQVHTGIAELSGSEPMFLEAVIAKNPNTRFVLFHSGFPWTHQVSGIVHKYKNAYANLSWVNVGATSAGIRALQDYIDISPSINTITWGSDCATAEESVGSMLSWRHTVATVLTARYMEGSINAHGVEQLSKKLMYENGRKLYIEHVFPDNV
jgi:hypothetical protein